MMKVDAKRESSIPGWERELWITRRWMPSSMDVAMANYAVTALAMSDVGLMVAQLVEGDLSGQILCGKDGEIYRTCEGDVACIL